MRKCTKFATKMCIFSENSMLDLRFSSIENARSKNFEHRAARARQKWLSSEHFSSTGIPEPITS